MDPQGWKKVLIERITNTRYDRVGESGKVTIKTEHVWRDQRISSNNPLDPGIAANRHQTWLFQEFDHTRPPPNFARPRDSVHNDIVNNSGNDHPGTAGVPAKTPSSTEILKINMLIQLASELGLWYDRPAHTPAPVPNVIYEDVYHVLRAKIQQECADQLIICFLWLENIFANEFNFEKMPPQRFKEMLCEAGLPFWNEFCNTKQDPAEAIGNFFEEMPEDWSTQILERSGAKEISEKSASEFMLQHVLSFIKRTQTDHEWW